MAGLREFVVQFGTEEQCIERLAGLRWPGGFACVLGQHIDRMISWAVSRRASGNRWAEPIRSREYSTET
jgi:hypothetical protein